QKVPVGREYHGMGMRSFLTLGMDAAAFVLHNLHGRFKGPVGVQWKNSHIPARIIGREKKFSIPTQREVAGGAAAGGLLIDRFEFSVRAVKTEGAYLPFFASAQLVDWINIIPVGRYGKKRRIFNAR